MASKLGLEDKILNRIQESFSSDPKNIFAVNVCTRYDPLEMSLHRPVVQKTNHHYDCTVKPEGRPVTNQKSSGRCWIFAMLNVARQHFIQKYNLEDFEFSQTHLYFWDKIERSYFFLDVFVELAKKKQKPDGRLLMFLLTNPINDGGQWDMLVNLVEKYGMLPRSAWLEPYNATSSRNMNRILNHKLREYCQKFQTIVENGCSNEEIEKEKEKMMTEIYRIVAICLGSPPETFDWEYYDKNKKFNKLKGLDSIKFYTEHVKPVFNITDKICLVNDARSTSPYDKLYTVQYLGNMVNGRRTIYLNQPIETLKCLAVESIKNNEPVWFGCDVGKHFNRSLGVLDTEIHNYELAFGINMKAINKGDRLIYGDSLMTHAMVLTGFSTDDDLSTPKPLETDPDKAEDTQKEPVTLKPITATKWRVENSWGEDSKSDCKGYLMMTDDWFSQYVYEVVVDKKFVPAEIMSLLDQEHIIELPAWDPMGALACTGCENHGILKSTL